MAGQPTFVVAGNQREFLAWCLDNDVNPNTTRVRYLRTWHQLRGCTDPHIEYYGTYKARTDWPQLSKDIDARTRGTH